MNPLSFIGLPSTIYGWMAVGAFIVSSVLYLRQNDIKALRSANTDLRDEIEDKQRQLTDLQDQIDKLKNLVDKLQTMLGEKEKRIDALENVKIVQMPSPDVSAYMSDMKQFATQAHQYMLDSSRTLAELNAKITR